MEGLGLPTKAQFISRAPATFPCSPSFHVVLPEDDAVGVALAMMCRTDWLRRSPSFSASFIFASVSSEAWTLATCPAIVPGGRV